MDIVNRYLSEIRRNLPRTVQADDVIAEIADELHSQIEDGGNELDVVRAYGNPYVVASRYAKQQALIGPNLLPFYYRALRLAIATVLAVGVLLGVIRALATGTITPFWIGLDFAFNSVIYILGIVTLIFAVMENTGRIPAIVERWDPRKLPLADAVPYPRGSSGFEFIANIGMMLVLVNIAGASRGFFSLAFAPLTIGSTGITLTAAWQPAYAGLVLSSAIVALTALVAYINPYLLKVRYAGHVIGYAIAIAGFGMTLHAGSLLSGASSGVNDAVGLALMLGIAAAGVAAAFDLWHLFRQTRSPLAGRAATS